MKIELGVGIGRIQFGMQDFETIDILGIPSTIKKVFDNEIEHHYNSLRLSLRFEQEADWRLAWIETDNHDCQLFDHPIIGLSKTEALAFLAMHSLTQFSFEEYTAFDTLFFEAVWLEFEIVFGTIHRLKFGTFIDDNDEYIWP